MRVLAAHNAEVYLQAGLESMAHTWRMVGIMLSGVPGGLLLPLGARIPDIDVAGIDAGVAAAVAAARDAAGGGAGEWAAKDKMAGAGGGREFDANVGRESARGGVGVGDGGVHLRGLVCVEWCCLGLCASNVLGIVSSRWPTVLSAVTGISGVYLYACACCLQPL